MGLYQRIRNHFIGGAVGQVRGIDYRRALVAGGAIFVDGFRKREAQLVVVPDFTGAEYQEGYEPFAIAQRAGAGGKGEAARGPAAGFLMILIPVAIGLSLIHI